MFSMIALHIISLESKTEEAESNYMYASKHAATEVTISHQSNTEVIITIYHNINFGNYHQPIN